MQIITHIWVGFVGWMIGILVNYLSDVLPWRRKFVHPFCLYCQQNQSLFNYILWPRKCPNCGKRRHWRSWIVELLWIVVSIWLWSNHPEKLGYWGSLLVLGFFSVVIVIDIEYKLILHPVSLFGAALGLLVGVYLHGFIPSLLGGVIGFGSMLVLYWLGGVLLRFTARRRGEEIDDVALGFGDVNLSGVIGLMLGFPAVILGLFLAILIGGAVSLIYLVVMSVLGRYRLFSALPYGPFLVAGAVLLLFFKDFLSVIFS